MSPSSSVPTLSLFFSLPRPLVSVVLQSRTREVADVVLVAVDVGLIRVVQCPQGLSSTKIVLVKELLWILKNFVTSGKENHLRNFDKSWEVYVSSTLRVKPESPSARTKYVLSPPSSVRRHWLASLS